MKIDTDVGIVKIGPAVRVIIADVWEDIIPSAQGPANVNEQQEQGSPSAMPE